LHYAVCIGENVDLAGPGALGEPIRGVAAGFSVAAGNDLRLKHCGIRPGRHRGIGQPHLIPP